MTSLPITKTRGDKVHKFAHNRVVILSRMNHSLICRNRYSGFYPPIRSLVCLCRQLRQAAATHYASFVPDTLVECVPNFPEGRDDA